MSDGTGKVKEVQEPIVKASIIVPDGWFLALNHPSLLISNAEYLGEIMALCFKHRAENVDHRYLDSTTTAGSSARTILTCTLPLSEIVSNFFNDLKGRSSGFASFE